MRMKDMENILQHDVRMMEIKSYYVRLLTPLKTNNLCHPLVRASLKLSRLDFFAKCDSYLTHIDQIIANNRITRKQKELLDRYSAKVKGFKDRAKKEIDEIIAMKKNAWINEWNLEVNEPTIPSLEDQLASHEIFPSLGWMC